MKHIGLLCLIGVVVFACTAKKAEDTELPYTVSGDTIIVSSQSPVTQKLKSAIIKQEPFRAAFATSGVVKAIPTNYAEIASPFAGRITKSFVRLGQKVAKGSPIFEISSPSFFETGKNYYQAKQEMELALKNLKREKDLYANKVGAQKEVEEAEVNYEITKKDYENAFAALKVFQINPSDLILGQPLVVRSPIAGEVVTDNIVIGQYMKEDANPVAIIADLNKVWVAANVKEKDMPLIHSLSKVQVELISLPEKVIDGTIYHISDMLNEETRAVEVLIECNNQDHAMKPGMYGTVKLTDSSANVIMVPTSAILQQQDHPYVLVSLGDNRYLKRAVTTSATVGDKSVILSGLTPGEQVVNEGAFYLIDAR